MEHSLFVYVGFRPPPSGVLAASNEGRLTTGWYGANPIKPTVAPGVSSLVLKFESELR